MWHQWKRSLLGFLAFCSVGFSACNASQSSPPIPSSLVIPYKFFQGTTTVGIGGIQGRTGHIQWRTNIGFMDWPPIIVGNLLFLDAVVEPENTPMLFALRLTDGAILWKTPLAEQNAESAILGGDATTVFVNAHNTLSAYNAQTGTLRWQDAMPPSILIEGRPSIVQNMVLYQERNQTTENPFFVVAVHADTGAVAWQHPSGGNIPADASSTAIFATDQAVYITDVDRTLLALQLTNGQMIWHSQAKGNVVAINSNTIILEQTSTFGLNGQLIMVNAASGVQQWSYAVTQSYCPLAIAGNILAVADGPSVSILNIQSKVVLWQKNFGAGFCTITPLIEDGVLYLFLSVSDQTFTNQSNELFAFKLSTGQQYWVDALADGLDMAEWADQTG